MIRWIFNLASALSLVLCLATGVVLVRGYLQWEEVYVAWGPLYYPGGRDGNGAVWSGVVLHRTLTLASDRGAIAVWTGWGDWMNRHHRIEIMHKPVLAVPADRFPWLSFRTYSRYQRFPSMPVFSISMPTVVPMLVFAVLPVAWGLRLRRRRRAVAGERVGFCSACGYDLRASKERCPECGTPISIKIEAQI